MWDRSIIAAGAQPLAQPGKLVRRIPAAYSQGGALPDGSTGWSVMRR